MLPEVKVGDRLDEILVRLGFAKSKSEARRLIEQGAVKLSRVPSTMVRALAS